MHWTVFSIGESRSLNINLDGLIKGKRSLAFCKLHSVISHPNYPPIRQPSRYLASCKARRGSHCQYCFRCWLCWHKVHLFQMWKVGYRMNSNPLRSLIPHYTASKHGVVGWTRSMQPMVDVANIRVNAGKFLHAAKEGYCTGPFYLYLVLTDKLSVSILGGNWYPRQY